MIKVSVIVPVYNVEKYLEQCLNSILAQTLKDIEIICVNDGSPDNSKEILERYAELDSRVKIINQENGGLSNARNNGMRQATGKYVAFVDSDDFIEADMIEKLYNRAEETCSDITVGDIWIYDHQSGKTHLYRDQGLYIYLKNKVFNLKEYPEFITSIAAWDRIYLRSFLERINAEFPEGLIYEDALFTAYTLSYAERISLVTDQLYYYRKNAGGSITDDEAKNERNKLHFLEINRRIQAHLKKMECSEDIRFAYLHYFFAGAYMHQMNCKRKSLFVEFFDEIQKMLTDRDYDYIQRFAEEPLYSDYLFWLRNKNGKAMWRALKRRKYLVREGWHIYVRKSENGRLIKLI